MSIPPPHPSKTPLVKAASFRAISAANPYWFGNLIHLYVELKLNVNELEGAESVEKAKLALSYIGKAADAAHLTCEVFDGQLLEIHGRTLHLGLVYDSEEVVEDKMKGAAGLLHLLLRKAYGSGGPDGWTMAAAHAPTLTIESAGIHKDTSLVSLSPAANYPAKALGKKLVPLWSLGSFIKSEWECETLDALSLRYNSKKVAETVFPGRKTLTEEVLEKRAKVVNFSSLSEIRQVNFQAAPLDGQGFCPSAESPFSCFGFVLSMDLDGFTKRVDAAAIAGEAAQMDLAQKFLGIMQDAKTFADDHPEYFIQFPFAGDNAIFAVTASNIHEFKVLKKRVPVEIAVEWEEAMGESSREAGFGGWGQASAAGGIPHGNSKGNLHVGGIDIEGRRFLVGIGPGMRYTRQAFGHVEPHPDEVAMSSLDTPDLHPRLAKEFNSCGSTNGGTSSYYRKAKLEGLERAVSEIADEQEKIEERLKFPTISLPAATVPHRPYFRKL